MIEIRVLDAHNEEAKQEEAIKQPIEEANQEVNEVVEETASGSLNSNPVGVETKQEAKTEEVEESKDIVQVEKKVSPQDKLVRCPKCNREMKLKSYRYGHEQKCQGTLKQKPVKPFSKPRAKPKAQPIIKEVDASASDEVSRGFRDEEETKREALPGGNLKLPQEVNNQVLKNQRLNQQIQ